MLTPPNRKLGTQGGIWSFSLPSKDTCPGSSALCRRQCYSARLEAWRPSVRERYQQNLLLSRRNDFADRMIRFIERKGVKVVRIHAAGDFDKPEYAKKWLKIMRSCSATRFYFYTRSWRVPEIRRVFNRMSKQANVSVWYSCDHETGAPRRVAKGVRLAWMMTEPGHTHPRADLIFRTQTLRRTVEKRVGLTLVCPTENGATGHRTDCARCGVCWE